MDKLIIIGGIFNLGIAIFHIMFWKIFRWKSELPKLKKVNQGVLQVLNLCLVLCFLFFSYISIIYSYELLTTELGNSLLIFISLFWLIRGIEQFIFFSYKLTGSILIILLSVFGFLVYFIPVIV